MHLPVAGISGLRSRHRAFGSPSASACEPGQVAVLDAARATRRRRSTRGRRGRRGRTARIAAALSPPPTTVKPAAVGDRLGDRARAGRERRDLEHAHRAVPEHRARVGDRRRRTSAAVSGPMSRPFQPSGIASTPHVRAASASAVIVRRDDDVGRDRAIAGPCEQLAAVVDLVGLDERVADVCALRGEERERHRAADERACRTRRAARRSRRACRSPSRRRAPRRTAASASSSSAEQHLDLAGQQPARRADGSTRGGPTIDAWARCDGAERVVRRTRRRARDEVRRRTRGRSPPRPDRTAGSRAASTRRAPSSRQPVAATGRHRVLSSSRGAPLRAEPRSGCTSVDRVRAHDSLRAATSIVGSAARMRRSSVISPSRSGTLKSARSEHPLCRRRQRQVLELRDRHRPSASAALARADELDEVDEAVRVAPLVVVPAEHLHHVAHRHRVEPRVKMHDAGLPTMSADTSGSSVYSSTPGQRAARPRPAERVVDLVDGRRRASRTPTKSVIEPVGHRAPAATCRRACPS